MAFSLKARLNGQSTSNQRADGYTNESPVFSFQADIERQISQLPRQEQARAYKALRSALASARNQADVSTDDLYNAYNAAF